MNMVVRDNDPDQDSKVAQSIGDVQPWFTEF